MLITALPIAVGALGRVPVGLLTDRYGPRLVFPAVSLLTAVPVLTFGRLDPLPAVVAAGCLAGLGGTAFPVGAAVVAASYPSRRRGLAAGVLGLGTIGGALASTATRRWFGIDSHRTAALVLATLLVAYAVVAALALAAGTRSRSRRPPAWRRCADVLRLPAGRRLTALHALSAGALAALALSLPAFLYTAYGLSWPQTVAPTMGFIAVAAAGQVAGGWLTDREDPVRVLTICGVLGAALALLLALHPTAADVAAGAMFGLAMLTGIAAGVTYALVCKLAPRSQVGTVSGVVGAVGGLGGLLLPLALSGLYEVDGSYAVGLTALAALLLGSALYLRTRPGWHGATLDLLGEPARSRDTTTTLVALRARDAAAPDLVGRVAELAVSDELVVVYDARPGAGGVPPHQFVAALRHRLPRHRIVALLVDGPRNDTAGRGSSAENDLVRAMVDEGAVPVVVTTTRNPLALATEIAESLPADRVLHAVADTPVLRPRWPAAPLPTASGG